jgi:hypothetical protein
LHLQIEGLPYPSIQWYKNGYILINETKHILHIENVNKIQHEGTYTCQLQNIGGIYNWLESTIIIKNQDDIV